VPPTSDNLPVKRTRDSDAEILRKLKHYLVRREEGKLFHAACRESDVSPDTVKRYRKDHPDFAEAEHAAASAGIELAEEVLQDKAMDGDYQSLAKFLEANDDKYKKQNITERQTLVVISADNALEKVQILKEELERRRRDIPEGVVGTNPFLRADKQAPSDPDDSYIDAEIVDE
jgi:hypothetical protein